MSRTIARAIAGFAHLTTAPLKTYRRRITRALVCEQMVQTVDVKAGEQTLVFSATTARSLHDVLSLGRGEPETVAWLDGLGPGVLWDIGANVGLYSLYAACVRQLRVIAFEPSAATFAALAKNVELNGESERIAPYCVALGERTRLDRLWMTSSNAGHSMHSVGERGGREKVQAIPVFAGDDFVRIFDAPKPRYLKIDVDGQEPEILIGCMDLVMRDVRSVLVEAQTGEAECLIKRILEPAGFRLAPVAGPKSARNLIFDR